MSNDEGKSSIGAGICPPSDFVISGMRLFGGVILLGSIGAFSFAVFVFIQLMKTWSEPGREMMPIRFEGKLVSPQFAISVFGLVAIVFAAIGLGLWWLSYANSFRGWLNQKCKDSVFSDRK